MVTLCELYDMFATVLAGRIHILPWITGSGLSPKSPNGVHLKYCTGEQRRPGTHTFGEGLHSYSFEKVAAVS